MRPAYRSVLLVILLSLLFATLMKRARSIQSFTPGNGWMNTYFGVVYMIASPGRKSAVADIMTSLDIQPEYVPATDSTKLTHAQLVSDNVITDDCLLSMPVIAANMGQLVALGRLGDSDFATAFIFEDSIAEITGIKDTIDKVMNTVPNDWDIINFGRCLDICKGQQQGAVSKSINAQCRFAYAITKAAAEKVVSYTTTLKGTDTPDAIISGYAKAGNLNIYVPEKALFRSTNKNTKECLDES